MGDLKKLINQINSPDEKTTPESKKRQEGAVRDVYRFCENTSECRRVQILQHFDERFDKEACAKGCDTCQESRETVSTNVTPQVLTILRMIQTVNQELKEKVTRNQLQAVLRGSKSAEVKSKNFDELPGHGCCKDLDLDLLELILNRLEFLEIIMSVSESNKMRFHCDYLVVRGFLHLSKLSSLNMRHSWVRRQPVSCSTVNLSSLIGTVNLTRVTTTNCERRLQSKQNQLARLLDQERGNTKLSTTILSSSSTTYMTCMTILRFRSLRPCHRILLYLVFQHHA
jgi:superfamily II DNA helicase RecQ